MPSNERSAEWLRGAVAALFRMIDECDVVMGGDLPHITQSSLEFYRAEYIDLLAAAEAREAGEMTKAKWIERYGGQSVLDREGFDVVPCVDCGDSICHGWRVVPREAGEPTAAEELKWAKNETEQVTALYDEAHEKLTIAEGEIARLNDVLQKAEHTAAEVIEAAERELRGGLENFDGCEINPANYNDCNVSNLNAGYVGLFQTIEAALALIARWKEANGDGSNPR